MLQLQYSIFKRPVSKSTVRKGQRAQQERSTGWLLLAIALLFATMLAQHSYGSMPDKTGGGAFYWMDAQGQEKHYEQAVLVETDVQIDIRGMSAAVTVKQTFANDSDSWQEGIYVFPLPENSAVHKMSMIIGERVIHGHIAEKQEAQKTYAAAKANGQKAALVEQERPNLFRQAVANIGPGETVKVELQYQQPIHYDSGNFALRFPMTLTPRYIPGELLPSVDAEMHLSTSATGWAQPTTRVPDAERITPPQIALSSETKPKDSKPTNLISLAINLDAGYPLQSVLSSTHKLNIDMPASGKRHIKLSEGRVPMDRDFELRWRPQSSSAATAAVFHELKDGDSYIQLMLLPPAVRASATTLPRELTMIIDTSGSMAGPSMQQAKQSLLWALEHLNEQDNFNIIAFESKHQVLFRNAVPATHANIAQAKEFVRSLDASGGTEMAPALHAALTQRQQSSRLKQVVFVTDGAVGNEAELFQLIDRKLGSARLFTVGIGSAPNSYFMRTAAEFGRGTFTYIRDTQEVAERMSQLFDKLSNPAMSGIEVHWPGATTPEVFPEVIPDLYLGEPLLVSAKIPGGLNSESEIAVFGDVSQSAWRRYVTVPPANNSAALVATHWARKKIASLLDEKLTGRPAEDVRNEVLQVALPFQLMSPYTSLVAVEQITSRPADEELASTAIPNLLPNGHSSQPLVYPQTATSASFHLLSGLLVLLLLWVIRRGLTHG